MAKYWTNNLGIWSHCKRRGRHLLKRTTFGAHTSCHSRDWISFRWPRTFGCSSSSLFFINRQKQLRWWWLSCRYFTAVMHFASLHHDHDVDDDVTSKELSCFGQICGRSSNRRMGSRARGRGSKRCYALTTTSIPLVAFTVVRFTQYASLFNNIWRIFGLHETQQLSAYLKTTNNYHVSAILTGLTLQDDESNSSFMQEAFKKPFGQLYRN